MKRHQAQISRKSTPGRRVASRDKVCPKGQECESVQISKIYKVSRKKAADLRKKPGGSNVGKYKNVPTSEFAGPAGGAPKGSYPINTKARAKSALKLAHNAPNPSGIKRKVYAEYPSLRPKKKK